MCLYSSTNATTTAVIAVTNKISGLALRKLNANLIPVPVALAVFTSPAIAKLAPLVAIEAVNFKDLPISLPVAIEAVLIAPILFVNAFLPSEAVHLNAVLPTLPAFLATDVL